MTTRATSWTGSESQRREQGGCAKAPRGMNSDLGSQTFVIHEGTAVEYMAGGDTSWSPYVTKKRIEFKGRVVDGQHALILYRGWKLRAPLASIDVISPKGNKLTNTERRRLWMKGQAIPRP